MYFQPVTHAYVSIPNAATPRQVIVAGVGPVGLTAALGLAQRGVKVLVLEAGGSASYGSRAICLSRNSLQVLDRYGVGQQVLDASLPWTGGRSYYRDQQVLEFQMPSAPEYARPPMVNISQSVVEQILIDAVEQEPRIALHWNARVAGVRQDDGHVYVDVDTPAGLVQVSAEWLVTH